MSKLRRVRAVPPLATTWRYGDTPVGYKPEFMQPSQLRGGGTMIDVPPMPYAMLPVFEGLGGFAESATAVWERMVERFREIVAQLTGAGRTLAAVTAQAREIRRIADARGNAQLAALADRSLAQAGALQGKQRSLTADGGKIAGEIQQVELERMRDAVMAGTGLGIGPAVVIPVAVAVAVVAAAGVFIAASLVHIQQVLATRESIRAIVNGALTPDEAARVLEAGASAESGGWFGDPFASVVPLLALGIGGWFLFNFMRSRR